MHPPAISNRLGKDHDDDEIVKCQETSFDVQIKLGLEFKTRVKATNRVFSSYYFMQILLRMCKLPAFGFGDRMFAKSLP